MCRGTKTKKTKKNVGVQPKGMDNSSKQCVHWKKWFLVLSRMRAQSVQSGGERWNT